MPTRKKTNNQTTKIILIAAGAVLLALAGFFGYRAFRNRSDTTQQTQTQPNTVTPATETEKQESEAHKEQLAKDSAQTTPPPTPQKKAVSVVITDASANGVRSYVTGVFEEGGTCTATATKGATTVTKSATGFENASYTQCAPINWDSALSTGTWNITVTYKSAAAEGTQSKTIEVK